MTAVEWLFDNLDLSGGSEAIDTLKKALEMEKQQAFEFWQGGINCTEKGGKSFEQYYNETYKK